MKYLIFTITIALVQFHLLAQKGNLIQLSPNHKSEFLKTHNKWRSEVGSPDIKWSKEMEKLAKDWAIKQGKKGCEMKHRPNNDYGENLFWSSGLEFSPKLAVNDWGSEIKDYKGEVFGKSKGVVGHYTQIVWRYTTEVGCAAYQCGNTLLVVCNYNPSGNWLGEHPYKK